MTIQQKVHRMSERMRLEGRECQNPTRRHYYSLLYDAVRFTGSRIVELENDSLVGYIELAAMVASGYDISFMDVRKRLIELGFNTAPGN